MNAPDPATADLSVHERHTLPPTESGEGDELSRTDEILPRPFGRYTLQRRLGRGGMGEVFLAHDALLGRQVALKVPRLEIMASPQALDRFHREARAAAQLDHPGICRILDVGNFENQPYITMVYVEGRPLCDQIDVYLGKPRQIATLLRQVALALEEAHSRGIVHRDLKPANVMITPRGEPVIMDFGLARLTSQVEVNQTSAGVVMGTPAYMSPEQANGDPTTIGPATDIYALGVILYELLTGKVPFQGSMLDLLMQVASTPPIPPSHFCRGIPPVLEAICLKALEKQPDNRFASAGVLASLLEDFLQGRGESNLALSPASPEQAAFEAMLREMRTFGWEEGWRRVRGWLPTAQALDEAGRQALLAWCMGSPGGEEAMEACFPEVPQRAALAGWVRAGRVLEGIKRSAEDLFVQVEELTATPFPGDPALTGQAAYLRGLVLAQRGRWEEASPWIHEALERLGRDHYLTGAVLDVLGRIQAGKCHFHAACEYYREAVSCKAQHEDEEGIVRSFEELGGVCLDWHLLDQAEEAFNLGFRLAQKLRNAVGEARLIYQLGRVVLQRGERALSHGRRASAEKRFRQASDYFEWAIRVFVEQQLGELEGLARAQLAVLSLLVGDLARAEEQLQQAEMRVGANCTPQTLAKLQRVQGRLKHAQGKHEDALVLLRQALSSYDEMGHPLQATRTQLELARVLATAQVPQRMVVRAYQDAATRAEACRNDELVEMVDHELESIDEEAYWRHSFERTRSTAAPLFHASLHRGISEAVSILCLELGDFEAFCRGREPQSVLRTLNQLLADFEEVIGRHRGHIINYLGSGFVALLREAGHADRAVQAALDLRTAVTDFNQPRGILGLPMLPARMGVASGTAYLGNLGTYRYLCFTAVGPVLNLARSIAHRADLMSPCISQETYDQVRDRFVYRSEGQRQLEIPGIGTTSVWDVLGQKRASGKRPSSRGSGLRPRDISGTNWPPR